MSSQRFRCLLRGSFTLVSLIHTCRDHQGHAFSPGRSPPQLLTKAAPGGLEPPPTRRLRRTYLHLPYSLTLSRLLDTITLTSLVVGTITNSRASSLHGHYSASSLSGRRWRACTLATVRRSNCTCSFPAYSFHEDSRFRDAIEGIN